MRCPLSTGTQEFKNENLSLTLTQQPGCRIRLEVILTPLATQAAYKKAVKMVSKEVSIPGFRKGKAPEETIIKTYGKHVEREWKDLLLNTAFKESIELSEVYPFSKDSISKASIKNVSLQDGATIIYEYESQPTVPTVSINDLTINPISRTAITEKDIDRTLETLQLQHAQWNDVNDRPAAEGDFVDITIDAIDEPKQNICKNTRFQIATGKMGTWMRELIIGMTPGQAAEKVSEKEPGESECKKCESGEEHHEHENFQPTLCRITLHSIKTPILPALDDDFAKKFGIETFDQLRIRIHSDLNKQADEELTQALRNAMEKKISITYPFDVPRSLIEDQIESQAEHIAQELEEKKLEESALKAETQNIKQMVANRLSHDYRLYFIAQQVVQDYKIKITEEELGQEYIRQLWLQQSGQSIINKDMKDQEIRSRLYANVLVNKALDYLIDQVQKKA